MSSPTIAAGTVYVGSYDSNVYALDDDTGASKWVFATGGIVFSSPAYIDHTVFVGSQDGVVYALGGAAASQRLPATPLD